MKLFRDESGYPRINAQANLQGRTHYVDPETLRWHRSRVLSARAVDNGLLFAITTSDALDMNNTRRGFRFVIFDVFGTVVSRPDLENAFRTHAKARKAMWEALSTIDALSHTLKTLETHQRAFLIECEDFRAVVEGLAKQKAA